MNLLSRIPVVREIIQSLREGDAAKHALEQLYSKHSFGRGVAPGQWMQQIDPGSGNLKGVALNCACGQEHRLLSFAEIFAADMMCPISKTEINFLKAIRAVDASGKFLMTAAQVRAAIISLPIRPVLNQSTTRYLDTGVPDAPDDIKQERQRLMWI